MSLKESIRSSSTKNSVFLEVLSKDSDLVKNEIKDLLENFCEDSIKKAAKFSCLETSGKKIRPFLFIETLKLLEVPIEPFLPVAAAIEICHVYSLIHDDLPSMDNDAFRRGFPSCHKKFNEATALLTGDALLTYSFEIMSSNRNIPVEKKCKLITEFAKAVGASGMVGGQALDMQLKNTEIAKDTLITLHRLKTGKLIEFSCLAASIIGDATIEEENAIQNFAMNFGLLFQITDDILDYNQKASLECNVVSTFGILETKDFLQKTVNKAILSLEIFGDKANILKSLVEFTLNRQN